MSIKEESGLDFNIKLNESERASQNNNINNNNNNNNNSNSNNNENNNEKNSDISLTNFYKKSSNPYVSLITVLSKLLSLILFLFMNIFTSNDSYTLITVIIFGSIDFWYTKNISGRILVGLRWWNQIKKNGEEVWIYESKNEYENNSINYKIFWNSLYLNTFIWAIFCFWEFIKFNFIWCCLCVVMVILSGTNLFSYLRCSKIQRKNIVELGKNIGKKIGKNVNDVGKNVIANQLY
jgi:hypothetical protein